MSVENGNGKRRRRLPDDLYYALLDAAARQTSIESAAQRIRSEADSDTVLYFNKELQRIIGHAQSSRDDFLELAEVLRDLAMRTRELEDIIAQCDDEQNGNPASS